LASPASGITRLVCFFHEPHGPNAQRYDHGGQNNFHEDEQKARDDVQGFGQEAKKKIGDRDGQAKEPQRQL